MPILHQTELTFSLSGRDFCLLSRPAPWPIVISMKTFRCIKGLAAALGAVCLMTSAAADPVRIFAAASLQGPLDQIAAQWDPASTVSYASSGTMARQISLGAPADVVLLASDLWADWLVTQGHVAGPPHPFLSNRLVLITPRGGPEFDAMDAATLRAALGDGRLAIGQHMSVPAGTYAKAWLTHIGAWNDVRTQLAETENVRAALALVARGEAPLGVVYATDAQASDAVSVAWTVPAGEHPTILYYAMSLTPQGAAFVSDLARHLPTFEAAGFVGPP